MKLTIKINMENAAFEDNPSEIGRILHCLADQVNATGTESEAAGNVRDINGNHVGTVKITK